MDCLLSALALFNLLSVVTIFKPRALPERAIVGAVFVTALLATELAWLWLPLQMLLAGLMVLGGALDSTLGFLAMVVLAGSWLGLAFSIWISSESGAVVETALQAELGANYTGEIPPAAQARLRQKVTFSDWCKPLSMRREGVKLIKDIPYGPAGVRQQLDIYLPSAIPEGGCPVVLQIHGGGWMVGDKGSQALPLMNHLASRGWICVAANYRLSPSVSFPTHLQDLKAALCWIREHGADYGMNPDFVAVTGGSAGGHLTALMGLTANRPDLQPDHPGADTSVQAAIPFYGVYDLLPHGQPGDDGSPGFLDGRLMHETLEDNPELWALGSPVAQVNKNAPPFMVLHGSHDSLAMIDEGRTFSRKLREVSDNPVVFVEFPGAEHAWDNSHSLRTEYSIDGVHRFLEWALAVHERAGPPG
jgi:acetyl esterase/lipase